jgi:hypothetical protein
MLDFRTGSDSGHGTTSSSRGEETQWIESPILQEKQNSNCQTSNLFHKDTLLSGIAMPTSETSHHSYHTNTYGTPTQNPYAQNGGEYAQIEILPTSYMTNPYNPYGYKNATNQSRFPTEPIYESLDHC